MEIKMTMTKEQWENIKVLLQDAVDNADGICGWGEKILDAEILINFIDQKIGSVVNLEEKTKG
jgi:hypothetical protein